MKAEAGGDGGTAINESITKNKNKNKKSPALR
jgi:hypothetical protein